MHLFESETVLHGRGAFAICPDCGTRNELAVVDVVDGCGQGGQKQMSEEKVNRCCVQYVCSRGEEFCRFAKSVGELKCVFFDEGDCTSSRAAAAAVRVEAELVTDTDKVDEMDKTDLSDKVQNDLQSCCNCGGEFNADEQGHEWTGDESNHGLFGIDDESFCKLAVSWASLGLGFCCMECEVNYYRGKTGNTDTTDKEINKRTAGDGNE